MKIIITVNENSFMEDMNKALVSAKYMPLFINPKQISTEDIATFLFSDFPKIKAEDIKIEY